MVNELLWNESTRRKKSRNNTPGSLYPGRAWPGGRIFIMLLVLSFGTEIEAQAYLDPGTGSLLWQMLVAALVGGVFYLRKLDPRKWFRRR